MIYIDNLNNQTTIKDGTFENPYLNLEDAISQNNLRNDGEIIIKANSDNLVLKNSIVITSETIIKSINAYGKVELNSGTIYIQNKTIFDNIVFHRAKVDNNLYAFYVKENFSIDFSVSII